MKNLVIVESPSKSKTIEKYLGPDYEVVSSKGHIRDLAIKGKGGLGVDIENNFEPSYSINKDKKETVKELKKEAKKCDFVYLATDPDREGEAISWHLAEVLGLDVNAINRVVFNEITKNAVIKAFDKPRTIDMGLVKSQETRRILDRIIGFKLSKLLKSKIQSKSAGRVQSVALKMVVDREKEIRAFNPIEYWTLDAIFNNDNKEFKTSCDIKKVVKQRKPKLPFITSTLQQESSSKLGYSAKRTMSIAQRLYEGIQLDDEKMGLITYMRTDSTRLSNDFVKDAQAKIKNDFGNQYLGSYKVKNDEQSQDAHEAIRPTSLKNVPEEIEKYLKPEEYKLYRFIYYRTLASLMANVKNNTVTITFSVNGLDFTVNGSQMIFDGYLKVYSMYDGSKDVILPDFELNEKLSYKDLISEQHFTEPPLRYTESKLIKALEEQGIGRPSTYASILDTLQVRGYTELKAKSETSRTKYFFPTEQGELTDKALQEFFHSIINEKYTANMENELDEISVERLESTTALRNFYEQFEPLLEEAYEKMEKRELERTGDLCPECGGELVYRVGRFGKFISCVNFPTCKYTQKIVDPNKYVPEKTGIMCSDCGNELVKRKSRYGKFFYGCSNYPKCKHVENLDEEGNVISVVTNEEAQSKKTSKKTASKKTASKKSSTKKSTTKKSTTKKSTAKKTTSKKEKKDKVVNSEEEDK